MSGALFSDDEDNQHDQQEHDDDDDDEGQQQHQQRRESAVKPLKFLTLKTITTKIERYPPEAFGVLPPELYDSIIHLRHAITEPSASGGGNASSTGINNSMGAGGLDGTGRMMPAIPAKVMGAIEESNPHLSRSDVADKLVWKDCVEFAFKRNSDRMRPRVLLLPWTVLIAKLKSCGEDLMTCWNDVKGGGGGGDSDDDEEVDTPTRNREKDVARRITTILRTFREAPACVEVLTASGMGKTVSKFLKQCGKRKLYSAQWTDGEKYIYEGVVPNGCLAPPRPPKKIVPSLLGGGPSPLAGPRVPTGTPMEQFEQLLVGWKAVAKADGVKMSRSSSSSSAAVASSSSTSSTSTQLSGKNDRTTEAQHRKDIETLQACKNWRQLYAALDERREQTRQNVGAAVRAKMQGLKRERATTKAVNIKTRKANHRLEGMLDGSNRKSLITTAGTVNAGPRASKIAQVRMEAQVQASFSKAGAQRKVNAKLADSVFGFSIANAKSRDAAGSSSAAQKRKVSVKRGAVDFGDGKRMKMPTRKVNTDRDVSFGHFGTLKQLAKKDVKKRGEAKKPGENEGKRGGWMARK